MRRRLGEVDVVLEAMLAGTFQQPKQCSPFVCSGSTADHNDDAMMWPHHCEMEKVVPVVSQQQATTVVGKLEDSLVGGIAGKGFTQELHSEASAICLATSKSISPRWSS